MHDNPNPNSGLVLEAARAGTIAGVGSSALAVMVAGLGWLTLTGADFLHTMLVIAGGMVVVATAGGLGLALGAVMGMASLAYPPDRRQTIVEQAPLIAALSVAIVGLAAGGVAVSMLQPAVAPALALPAITTGAGAAVGAAAGQWFGRRLGNHRPEARI